jgi:endo-1,4-beta-mannosidase
MTTPFVLGVNYWPRRKAMYWWRDFDAGEVREEFTIIRELGLSLVRIFLLWDDWQPAPNEVSAPCLRNLVAVADTAADLHLKLDVTFFTGHMSGPNWAPRWLLHGSPLPNARTLVSGNQVVDSGYHNPYTYPAALAAERLLLQTVVSTLKDHPAIGMWNLGNEPDLFAWPPDAPTGRRWVAEMSNLVRSIDPHHPVTCGLHVDSLLRDNGLRVSDVFAETDLAVMHAYPMYANWARSPLDPDLVPFTCALTTALCGKPTLMQEFGGCTAEPGSASHILSWEARNRQYKQFMASEEDLAAYVEAVLPRLVEVGATGAMLWCFADYVPELWSRPPCDEAQHERFFGLVRGDGSLKPHAEVLRAFAATKPVCRTEGIRRIAEPLDPEAFYRDPFNEVVRLYSAW